MSAPSNLNIAIIGVGGIGSVFAFQLVHIGHHKLTVIARSGSKRLQQLQRDGGIVTTKDERADVNVADALDETVPYDLVIVTLLAHQVDAVLPALRQSAAKSILFMFNNFTPERLQDELGAERCAFGMPVVQSGIDKDGRSGLLTLSPGGQKSLISEQRWVDVFNAAEIPAVLEPNMFVWLRCNVPFGVAFVSVFLAGLRRGGGASWGECMAAARAIHESFALIQRLGYPLYPVIKARINSCPAFMVASLFWVLSRIAIRSRRGLVNSGGVECRALTDAMVAAAASANPPMTVEKIKAMRPPELGTS